MSADVGPAASLLSSLVSAESAIWGYYFVVVAGLTAGIVALSSNQVRLGNNTKIVITLVIAVFCIVNTNSLWATGDQINELITYISSKDADLGKVIAPMHLTRFAIFFEPFGLSGLVLWLWKY